MSLPRHGLVVLGMAWVGAATSGAAPAVSDASPAYVFTSVRGEGDGPHLRRTEDARSSTTWGAAAAPGPLVPGRRHGSILKMSRGELPTPEPAIDVAYATGDSPPGPFTRAAANPILRQRGPVKEGRLSFHRTPSGS